MALRCLLVGLVASLGFQLPSGQDVTSWTRPGRDWVAARTITLSDLKATASVWFAAEPEPAAQPPVAEPAPALAVAPAAEPAPDDLAFAAITEGMAASFAADLEVARAEEAAAVRDEPAPAPAAEAVAAADPTGEPEHESMALAHAEPAPEAVTPGQAEFAPEAVTQGDAEPAASPATRLTSAVRATREAMNAWASVVQAVGREVVAR